MKYDAVVIGSGPNGLSAAIEMARSGRSVCVVEASDVIGGGLRTAELTLPGFQHDVCSAIHPLAILSPFFQSLQLRQWGIEWVFSPAALAHPFQDGTVAMLYKDLNQTAELLGEDGRNWRELFHPLTRSSFTFFSEILRPVHFPKRPFLLARFGLLSLRSATGLAKNHFSKPEARALFAGCAAHSILSLDQKGSAAFGLVIAASGHAVGWPFPGGGSKKIADALVACLQSHGGEIETGRRIQSMQDLPSASVYLFDVTPRQLLRIAGKELTASYAKKLSNFQYGPGVFKIDWALNEPIPWKNNQCLQASTVHIGGSMEEIATAESQVWQKIHPEKPFILVAQQSLFDKTRTPEGKQTAWGYCHVPHGSTVDMTDRIERQIERFAPGFRDVILARHTLNTAELQSHNENYVGGDIAGGANNLLQVFGRPALRLNPYSTPNKKIYICSASTPPGGGVHGMCGYLAARAAIRKVFK